MDSPSWSKGTGRGDPESDLGNVPTDMIPREEVRKVQGEVFERAFWHAVAVLGLAGALSLIPDLVGSACAQEKIPVRVGVQVNDLRTGTPVDSAEVTLYNSLGKEIFKGYTRKGWVEAGIVSQVEDEEPELPADFALRNFPNPFSTRTTVFLRDHKEELVAVVYNVKGEEVARYRVSPEQRVLAVDLSGKADGMYFLRLTDRHNNKNLGVVAMTRLHGTTSTGGTHGGTAPPFGGVALPKPAGAYDIGIRIARPDLFYTLRDTLRDVQSDTTVAFSLFPLPEVEYHVKDSVFVRPDSAVCVTAVVEGFGSADSLVHMIIRNNKQERREKRANVPLPDTVRLELDGNRSGKYQVEIVVHQHEGNHRYRAVFRSPAVTIDNRRKVIIRSLFPDSSGIDGLVYRIRDLGSGDELEAETSQGVAGVDLDPGEYAVRPVDSRVDSVELRLNVATQDTTEVTFLHREAIEWSGGRLLYGEQETPKEVKDREVLVRVGTKVDSLWFTSSSDSLVRASGRVLVPQAGVVGNVPVTAHVRLEHGTQDSARFLFNIQDMLIIRGRYYLVTADSVGRYPIRDGIVWLGTRDPHDPRNVVTHTDSAGYFVLRLPAGHIRATDTLFADQAGDDHYAFNPDDPSTPDLDIVYWRNQLLFDIYKRLPPYSDTTITLYSLPDTLETLENRKAGFAPVDFFNKVFLHNSGSLAKPDTSYHRRLGFYLVNPKDELHRRYMVSSINLIKEITRFRDDGGNWVYYEGFVTEDSSSAYALVKWRKDFSGSGGCWNRINNSLILGSEVYIWYYLVNEGQIKDTMEKEVTNALVNGGDIKSDSIYFSVSKRVPGQVIPVPDSWKWSRWYQGVGRGGGTAIPDFQPIDLKHILIASKLGYYTTGYRINRIHHDIRNK